MSVFPPITELLFHRDTMLLLDRMIACSDEAVTAVSRPDADAWYANSGGAMPAWIGIELMAQAIASHVALLARRSGTLPRPGALLGTRAYRAEQASFTAGEELYINARQTFRDATGLASYDCTICSTTGKPLASAALTVYEPKDFEAFILGTNT